MLRIGYLDEAAPAEFLDARVEELARTIASNAPIAMRGMKDAQRDRAQQALRSCRRPPPPREPARRQSAGRQRRPCREATAAVLRRGSPFRDQSSGCRAPGNWNSGGRGTPYGVTHTHFAIVSRSALASKS